MSTLAKLGATAAAGFLLGRLAAEPQLRRLRRHLHVAIRLASHDRLTGLPNRYYAYAAFSVRQKHALPTIVALIDLDRFKQVNDSYGHQIGDELLCVVAARLRDAATTHDGFAARLSGDEFLLLLPLTDTDATTAVAYALQTVAQPVTVHTDRSQVIVTPRASAGITVSGADTGDLNRLLHHADIALYHAKQQPGSHRLYCDDMRMPRSAGRHGPRRRDQRITDDHAGEVTA